MAHKTLTKTLLTVHYGDWRTTSVICAVWAPPASVNACRAGFEPMLANIANMAVVPVVIQRNLQRGQLILFSIPTLCTRIIHEASGKTVRAIPDCIRWATFLIGAVRTPIASIDMSWARFESVLAQVANVMVFPIVLQCDFQRGNHIPVNVPTLCTWMVHETLMKTMVTFEDCVRRTTLLVCAVRAPVTTIDLQRSCRETMVAHITYVIAFPMVVQGNLHGGNLIPVKVPTLRAWMAHEALTEAMLTVHDVAGRTTFLVYAVRAPFA
jgi:hypothetical protein